MDRILFASLVESFAIDLKLVTPVDENKGKYVHGEWVREDNAPVNIRGALVPYEDRVVYESGGTITKFDRQLFFVGDIPLQSIIIDGPEQYKVESVEEYARHYSDTNIYRVKAVDKLGKYI